VTNGSPLVRWLATLDAPQLAEVLVRRPDTLTPPPRTLSELAGRLQARDSVSLAFHGLPLPAVQVVEVMQSFGGPSVQRGQLADAFGRAADDPDLAATLHILSQRALVWPGPARGGTRDASEEAGESLFMAGPLWSAFPHPLRLGAPVDRLLRALPVARLTEIAAALGIAAGQTKKDTLRALCRRLADAEAVRALVEGAPAHVRELLVETAWNGPLVALPQGGGGGHGRRVPPELAWAVDRALLVPDGWRHAQMPAEVARALRGPQWRPRFDPRPPEPALVSTDPAELAREAAAAASTAVEQVATLLDACAGTPVAVLRGGGVGVRELRRLGKVIGCGEREARLWLELAYAAGLVAVVREQVLPTEAYDQWYAAEPAGRLVPLLRAWLRLPAAPLVATAPEAGGPAAALVRNLTGLSAHDLRPRMLDVLRELPEGQGVKNADSVEAVLYWRAPGQAGEVPGHGELIAALWQEAALLGVVAHGALTPLGQALLSAPEELAEVAARLLPAAVRTAMFQADLTAVVPGVPAADLAEVLDAAADRESRGGAVTWRFSPASVRRALDTGRDSTALLTQLRGFAVGGTLPQPLEYLIRDVARQHGAIRVRSAGCVLYADDPALLAEIASARPLSALRLAAVAPTVLVSAKPPEETLAALRAAGYAPVGESVDGTARVEKAPRRRAPAPRRRPRPHITAEPHRPYGRSDARTPADPHTLAVALLAEHAARTGRREPAQLELALDPVDEVDPAPDGHDGDDVDGDRRGAPEAGEAAASIARYAGHLTQAEQARLRAAIADGTPIEISYTNAKGSASVRVIEPIDLDDRLLVAWCQLRDEERAFALDRIAAVSPA
jgi:hypothetical protein